MFRKLIVLASFVLLLGSVSNAEDIQWVGGGADNLWSTPENWDLGRIPTMDDEVRIDVPAAAAPNGPVIQDGIDAKAKGVFTEAAGEPTLTITGGTLEVAEWIWWGDGADSFAMLDMSGGTLSVTDEFELGWGGGAGTLTITGGTINAGEAVVPTGSGAFGLLYLNGGTYNVTKPGGLEVNAAGMIDITEGTLVLEGDDTVKVNDLIAAGQITAYGGAGQINVDFNLSNPGKTTITAIESVVFLFDDFESYPADVVMVAAGWTISDTPEAIEASTWTVTNPGGRGNPATLDGSASTGNFLISDSDQQSESNPVDSGASHDISTPSFSTLGVTTVWLHADISAQLNNNGAAIFDIDVSTDGGITWANVFSRVSPGRVSSNDAITRLPDNTNADGYYGRLDVDLSSVAANQADVKVRFRHYEPNWDWWIAIDNVLIDNIAPPQGGPEIVFEEDFSNGLGQMNVVSGQGNTGTETWNTSDKGGRYVPGTVQEQGVNRLGPHPNEHPEFAIIDSDADPDPAEDEWLMTPVLDLSGLAEVFLHYDSETVMSDGVWNQEVLVSLDGGSTFEATPIFAYTGGGLFDGGEEPVFAERIFDVSSIAAGESQVVFAFRYTGDGDDWWWAIDNVKVSGKPYPEPVNPGTNGLLACYPLDGDANDISGNGINGTIYNADTGGLGEGGSVWVDDLERGTVISFNGTASGAYVRAGEIPQMTLTNDFTWSFWAKQKAENTADNDIILGNRMNENAVDFVPRQFIKFTPTKFEWHMNGNGDDNLEYDDIPADVWLHHAVVKTGDQLTYYRNGVEHSSGTFTQPLDFPQPLYFGGDNEGSEGENWNGLMSDVCIYDRALAAGEIRYLAGFRPPIDPVHSYTFEDGTGNDNIGDADGVLVGDAAIVNGSLVVDGDGDWMEMPGDVIAINTYSEMTLELWCTQSVDNPFSMTASFGGTWDNGFGKDYIFIATGRGDQMNRGAIANTPDDVNPWEDEVGVSSPELNDGIEHQYVLTITTEELAYYVDGVLIGTAPTGDTTIAGVSNDFVYLGKGIYSVDGTMNCSINEFNIYDVALDADQVAANYAVGPAE